MGPVEDGSGNLDVKSRLGAAWEANSIAETCGILLEEVRPRCLRWLLNNFGHQGLSEEDCEDCFNDGVEAVLNREPSQVSDPYNYVFTCAKNAALDILQERKHVVRYDPEWQGTNDDPSEVEVEVVGRVAPTWTGESMLIVAEAAMDVEFTVMDEQLRIVLGIALLNLPPDRRRLVEVLLESGANITNAVLADIMDRSETAVKSLKSRAFDDLRSLLPVAAQELGINFDHLLAPTPEAWVRHSVIPSPEDDTEPLP